MQHGLNLPEALASKCIARILHESTQENNLTYLDPGWPLKQSLR
jgi:hypothetical protein